MNKIISFLKKEPMLTVSVAAAAAAMIITPPTTALFSGIDWRTLATLFMMLTVLEGFKKENIFRPVLKLSGKIKTCWGLSMFLVFSVFFSSMFVTNDVSLIIFVPLTIILFREGGKERYILPIISMENIAAVRGSLLTPFGSPQNLFIFGQSGVSAYDFIKFMFPIWIISGVLLILFVIFTYRKDIHEASGISGDTSFAGEWNKAHRTQRIIYMILFCMIIWTIVSRTSYWVITAAITLIAVLITDRKILIKTDYILLLTFLSFFIFSSSVASNAAIHDFLKNAVAGHEYAWGILLSQVISNVPASIVLYQFSENPQALLYGLDSAGLCTLIGSLASVINYRIYVREYPKNGGKFIKVFTLISLTFFAFVVIPGYYISR